MRDRSSSPCAVRSRKCCVCFVLLLIFSALASSTPLEDETLDETEGVLKRDDDKVRVESDEASISPHGRLEFAKGRVWRHPKIKVDGEWRDDTRFEHLDGMNAMHATRHERYFGRMNDRAKKRDQIRAKIQERRSKELEAEAKAAGEVERIRRMKLFQERTGNK